MRLRFQIEQRLVVELERFALQRVAQIEFEVAARLGAGFHLGLEPAPGAAAVGLRPIERHVGVAQELVRVDRGVVASAMPMLAVTTTLWPSRS